MGDASIQLLAFPHGQGGETQGVGRDLVVVMAAAMTVCGLERQAAAQAEGGFADEFVQAGLIAKLGGVQPSGLEAQGVGLLDEAFRPGVHEQHLAVLVQQDEAVAQAIQGVGVGVAQQADLAELPVSEQGTAHVGCQAVDQAGLVGVEGSVVPMPGEGHVGGWGGGIDEAIEQGGGDDPFHAMGLEEVLVELAAVQGGLGDELLAESDQALDVDVPLLGGQGPGIQPVVIGAVVGLGGVAEVVGEVKRLLGPSGHRGVDAGQVRLKGLTDALEGFRPAGGFQSGLVDVADQVKEVGFMQCSGGTGRDAGRDACHLGLPFGAGLLVVAYEVQISKV